MRENRLAERLSLDGEWQIQLAGQAGSVHVPGVWERQGYSMDADGPAIYTRTVTVPANWSGAQIDMCFGAVSYFTEVYVNGQQVGDHEGLWTTFALDVTAVIQPGQPNHIELRITKPSNREDGQYPYRKVLVGFIPYVSTTFGGPWQAVELVAHRAPAWQDVFLAPDWRTGQVEISASVAGAGKGYTARIEIADQTGNIVAQDTQILSDDGADISTRLTVENPARWSPQNPNLYDARLYLEKDKQPVTLAERRFGFRRLETQGDQLRFNESPVCLRGILSWGWDPDTLAPTPSDDAIRAEFRRVRDLGFNLVKLCLFVPPARVFEIADEEGMFLWLELPMWYQIMDEHLREQATQEYRDILAAVHHHPSIIVYSLGCELGAHMADAALLDNLNTLARRMTCGVLVCDNSGSGEAYGGLNFDFADFNDYHFYSDLHYFTPLLDHFRRDWQPERPWIFGEFCYSDDYRDPAELSGASDVRPWWRDLLGVSGGIHRWAYRDQEQRMQALNLPFTDAELMHISRRQSFVVRKATLEMVRSRRGMGGYVITGLRDTPISTSGVFDDLGRSKFDPAAFRMFNADAVLALEQGRARVWKNGDRPAYKDRFCHRAGEPVSLRLVLAHTDANWPGGELRWRLCRPDHSTYIEGSAVIDSVPAGVPREIARLEWAVPQIEQAEQWVLEAELDDLAANRWWFWFFPALPGLPDDLSIYDPSGCLKGYEPIPRIKTISAAQGICIVSVWNPPVQNYVQAGGKVVLIQQGLGSLPVVETDFWGESITLLHNHPILSGFPHEGHADMQFYHLAANYAFDTAQLLPALPVDAVTVPVIQRLNARVFSLADYLMELRVGRGSVLASTLHFAGGQGDQVRSLQDNTAGQYLLRRMIEYLSHR
ncbi:MAG TPA: hypothetical protein VKY59_20905 [Spirillospora sp.]|nr:hypothetical protein [Spirillospora sp.]